MQVDTLLLDVLAADPGSPVEGQFWYNTTDKALRVYRNGATKDIEARKTTVTTTSPTTANDNTQGYEAGSRWLNTAASTDFVCVSAATGAAVWVSGGGGGGATPSGANGDVQFKGPGSTLNSDPTNTTAGFNYDVVKHSLTVGPTGANLTNNPFSANGNVNNYVQSNVQNTNNGASASSDIVATADNGNDNTRYVDFGINSSGYADATFTIAGANDGYVYCAGGAIAIGTDSNKDIEFFTGGTLAANDRGRITGVGSWVVGRAALATNATDGFIYMPGMPGIPTGSPTAFAGRVPMAFDTTNFVLYFNIGGTWYPLDPSHDQTDWKNSVDAATATALPANTRTGNVLTASANGTLTAQDGVTLVAGQRLLVKNEATAANNGIYVVTSVGSGGSPWVLTRSTDADGSSELSSGMNVYVTAGTTQVGDLWVLTTTGTIILNTTALQFGLYQPKAKYNEVNAAGTITTGSTTDVVATSMTLTPGQGTYLVVFSALLWNSAATNTTTISAYANGVQVANSERATGVASGTYRAAASLTCVVTVAAGQAIDIRWRVSAGTGSMGNRSLSLIRVA